MTLTHDQLLERAVEWLGWKKRLTSFGQNWVTPDQDFIHVDDFHPHESLNDMALLEVEIGRRGEWLNYLGHFGRDLREHVDITDVATALGRDAPTRWDAFNKMLDQEMEGEDG